MSAPAGPKQPTLFSIKDQKAVSDQLLPRLPFGFTPRGLHVSEWKIKDWLSTSPTSLKRSSPDFECGGHKWQIHLFPLGLVKARQQEQITPTPKTSIALYIVHSDNCHHSETWKVEADVVVAICNSQTPSIFIKQTYHHQFTPTTPLAGSHDFRRLRDIMLWCT
ncbi:hypothetical protein CPB83DRAFT_206747 [Crepidotus variabilis]|uniref:MATH domain-containing protein n=1 Tax=Crepidotus variabilis TaxID=179855 RepID=A0A9P6JWK6_9AGAR|nr:hypothetical protein CPB83DRAFT_206747 [Crepidotus variabilis]